MSSLVRLLPAATAALLMTGCGSPEQATTRNTTTTTTETTSATAVAPSPRSSATAPARDLTGRWIGVEGMFLDVAAGATPGTYKLTMQWDLDHKGSFAGTAEGDGIGFERDGRREVLRPSDGDATGLKYLAGKHDCLTVKQGEGYCRP